MLIRLILLHCFRTLPQLTNVCSKFGKKLMVTLALKDSLLLCTFTKTVGSLFISRARFIFFSSKLLNDLRELITVHIVKLCLWALFYTVAQIQMCDRLKSLSNSRYIWELWCKVAESRARFFQLLSQCFNFQHELSQLIFLLIFLC